MDCSWYCIKKAGLHFQKKSLRFEVLRIEANKRQLPGNSYRKVNNQEKNSNFFPITVGAGK